MMGIGQSNSINCLPRGRKCEEVMGYFPFFIELSGKKGVVIGGGKVAARKVKKLLEFGPGITVVARQIGDSIWELKRQIEERRDNPFHTGYLEIRQKTFQIEDLQQADFVIAATDQEQYEVNRIIKAFINADQVSKWLEGYKEYVKQSKK